MNVNLSELLSKPLAQDFTPSVRRVRGLGNGVATSLIGIYVEPVKASGLEEVIRPLRRALKEAKGTGSHEYAVLSGQGLKRSHAPRSWVEKFRDHDDEEYEYSCEIRYRLYVTDTLRPIGYCCFNVSISRWSEFEMELHEVWLNPAYRGRGLGAMLSERVADLGAFSLQEIDVRANDAGLSPRLGLAVIGDVYSKSGEEFVENTAQSLICALDRLSWSALKLGDVVAAPYW